MSDSGAGFIHGDAATFAHADGVYYHVQMLNGAGGQITEFVRGFLASPVSLAL